MNNDRGIFNRLRTLRTKKKQKPSALRQIVELHITEQDTDDEALKNGMLTEALSVFNASDQIETVVDMIGLYKAMEALVEAQGLQMKDIKWMTEQGSQQTSRFT